VSGGWSPAPGRNGFGGARVHTHAHTHTHTRERERERRERERESKRAKRLPSTDLWKPLAPATPDFALHIPIRRYLSVTTPVKLVSSAPTYLRVLRTYLVGTLSDLLSMYALSLHVCFVVLYTMCA
jgi:hypothetical protein